MVRIILSVSILLVIVLQSCNSQSSYEEDSNSSYHNDDPILEETNEDSECGFDDDNYIATVYYNNSKTGYSATYTLDVEVEDCQIVQINFPNDGYLDNDHITYADLDEDGNAFVYGEDGKTYEINID